MSFVRDALTGNQAVDLHRGERHALDGLLRLYGQASESTQSQYENEFAALLTDDDERVRAGAVVFFAKTQRADAYQALLAAWSQLHLFDGVADVWYPDGRDLRDLLAGALSRRTLHNQRVDVLDVMKVEALVPNRGQNVLSGLIPGDPDWVRANYIEVVRRSPDALAGLLMWLGMLGVQPEAVIGPAVGHLPEATIRSAIALAIPAERERMEAMFFA
ncbi:MAG: hypothetical protein KC912_13375 [Proteobacteria bacterium]|nr:hypothetical protein [Pseudomonadota bacterium]